MKYNFDEIRSRRGTHCVKWDTLENLKTLPMWIADMDFITAPEITEALSKRINHEIFGYTFTPTSFYDAISNWWKERHGYKVPVDHILPITGVIPALSSIIRAMTRVGDKIIIQPPVYNHFFISIEHSGCTIVENNLKKHEDGSYSINFEDLEEKAANSGARLMILSNPHNPAGRVWTKEELTRIGQICLANNIIVVSDEIHCDLVFTPYQHIPFASLDSMIAHNSITCSSPSKTFNIAGLQVAYMFTANEWLRKKVNRVLEIQENSMLSPFAIEALIAAYNQGGAWLEELKDYLWNNYLYLKTFCDKNLNQVKISPLQATYLAWLDCSYLNLPSDQINETLMKEVSLKLNEGGIYGNVGSEFMRINLACPRALLEEGLIRLQRGLRKLEKSKI